MEKEKKQMKTQHELKVKKSIIEELIYSVICVCTLGMAYVIRIVISQAIRKSFKNNEEDVELTKFGNVKF